MENKMVKKPKMLCLHPHISSGAEFKDLLQVWPSFVLEKMELVFIDAPFPYTQEDHRHTHIYPTFVWFNEDTDQYDKEFEEAVTYTEDSILKLGPFDGILAFSQGSVLAAALPGMQAQAVALTKVEAIKFVMLISGAKLGGIDFPIAPKLADNAFSSPIQIPSLHIFGENDFAKLAATELLRSFVDPDVIFHSGGHEVPKFDEEEEKVLLSFLHKIKAVPAERSIRSLL